MTELSHSRMDQTLSAFEVTWQKIVDPLESLRSSLAFDRRLLTFPHERRFFGKKPSLYIALFFQKRINHFFKITFFWLYSCMFQIKLRRSCLTLNCISNFLWYEVHSARECRTSDVLIPIYTSRVAEKTQDLIRLISLRAGNLPSLV